MVLQVESVSADGNGGNHLTISLEIEVSRPLTLARSTVGSPKTVVIG